MEEWKYEKKNVSAVTIFIFSLRIGLQFRYSVKFTSCKAIEDDHIGRVISEDQFSHSSNHLEYFYTPTRIGCHNHVGFSSPAYA